MDLTCDNCKTTQPLCLCIDVWCKIDNKDYCLNCQKTLKVGWYDEKRNSLLNLYKMEQNLDDALKKETKETLIEWLIEQRKYEKWVLKSIK